MQLKRCGADGEDCQSYISTRTSLLHLYSLYNHILTLQLLILGLQLQTHVECSMSAAEPPSQNIKSTFIITLIPDVTTINQLCALIDQYSKGL